MSVIALSAAVAVCIVLIALFFWIRGRYRLALTSVEEKRGGVISFYRVRLWQTLHGQGYSIENMACLVHYALLHLAAPLLLSAFLLHTDWNFLVAVGSILTSVQLVQRVFPGPLPDGAEVESD